MKALYIGPFYDGTGYGNMAINTMLAMDAAGIDVSARPIKLNEAKVAVPEQIREFEGRHRNRYDVVIQNLLPSMMDFNGNIPQNVAYYCSETSNFKKSGWADRINTMNQAWVCNAQSQQASVASGVTVPISVVPIATDISKYQRSYKPLSIREKLKDSFIFYYIGDFNKRKNIAALIKAFHLEFDVNEPVNVVIKTDVEGSADEYERMKHREWVAKEISHVKRAMKLYPSLEQYKEEIILVGRYTEEEIMRLHASCDCFVCPSYGEAWCIPAFDAMAMGKTPIVTNGTGFLEYMTDKTGWLVKSSVEPVFAMDRNSPFELFSSREDWESANIRHLQRCMRDAYSDQLRRQEKAAAGRRRAADFSYHNVGNIIKQAIDWS